MTPGAAYQAGGKCTFGLWAPHRRSMELHILSPEEKLVPMQKDRKGFWHTEAKNIAPDTFYMYRLDGELERPDPASNFQPEGPHGPSSVIDHAAFKWSDHKWVGVKLEDMIIYELHIGTFTPQGTFEAAIGHLDELVDLGITAVEIMPVSQFAGGRNWGYDGVCPYAVQNSYGGPDGLKKFVDACHNRGLAVILDVVYNHLGPEGNYLRDFGPYFTDTYQTPWGDALNYDGPYSDCVRDFFCRNAVFWFKQYHIDALRLDALHTIHDMSAKHFLRQLAEYAEQYSTEVGRKHYLIGESDLNNVRLINPPAIGGYGLDAQWNDDFHHSLYALITGERIGYYEDFGTTAHLAKAIREGFVYSWQYSGFRKRRHGSSSADRPCRQFVAFSQNHDQIGNRRLGRRLSQIAGFEAAKLAAGCVILSPYLPLLFMGEEYAEENPFLYFTSHTDPDLAKAVRSGRAEEFESFHQQGPVPDPQNSDTFQQSKLNHSRRATARGKAMLDYYKQLITIRKSAPPVPERKNIFVEEFGEKPVLLWHRPGLLCIANYSDAPQTVTVPQLAQSWKKKLDSADLRWLGPDATLAEYLTPGEQIHLQPYNFAAYTTKSDSPQG